MKGDSLLNVNAVGPTTTKRSAKTSVLVKNGDTVVLGGMMQETFTNTASQIPLLGDIPLLGWLFKKKDTIDRDKELMVFLRPVVTRTPEDVKRLLEEERRMTPGITQWEKELDARRAEREAEEKAAAPPAEKTEGAPQGTP